MLFGYFRLRNLMSQFIWDWVICHPKLLYEGIYQSGTSAMFCNACTNCFCNNKSLKLQLQNLIFEVAFVWESQHANTQQLHGIYIWHSPVPGNIFHWDFPFFSLFLFIQCLPQKIQASAFGRNLGCAPYAQISKFSKYSFFIALLLSSWKSYNNCLYRRW